MNLHDRRYSKFALVREMLETPRIVGEFDFHAAEDAARTIGEVGRLFLTGEGSSRIFPGQEPDLRGPCDWGSRWRSRPTAPGRPTSTT